MFAPKSSSQTGRARDERTGGYGHSTRDEKSGHHPNREDRSGHQTSKRQDKSSHSAREEDKEKAGHTSRDEKSGHTTKEEKSVMKEEKTGYSSSSSRSSDIKACIVNHTCILYSYKYQYNVLIYVNISMCTAR